MSSNSQAKKILGGVALPMSNGKLQQQGACYRVEVIAQLFGVTVRRIQQLTQEGILPTVETKDGRRYELVPTIQKYVEYLKDKAYGKSKNEAESELKQRKLEAEIELKQLQSEYKKIQNDISSGKYISIDEVESDYRTFFNTFKKFALSIPPKLSIRLVGFITDQSEIRTIESEINDDIVTLLTGFVVAGQSADAEMIKEPSKSGRKKAKSKNKKV